MAAPAPRPDKNLANARRGILGARDSAAAPATNGKVINRMARNLPCLLQNGPAKTAPMSPPRVKMEVTMANWSTVMGMHCGRLDCDCSFLPVLIFSFWHVMTA